MRTIAMLILSLFVGGPSLQAAQGQFTARPKGSPHGYYGYWEYLPLAYDDVPTSNHALIINLHGAGSQGNGSLSDLAKIKSTGPMANVVAGTHYPAVIVTPQLAGSSWTGGEMNYLSAFLDWARTNYRVDSNRIYVTGLSLGGGGTWGLAIRRTDIIAAAVPVCGALQPYYDGAEILVHTRIWATHNSNDGTVPTSWTHGWMKSISNIGGTFHQCKIFNTSGHNAWTATYNDAAMWAWLFSQKKVSPVQDVTAPGALAGIYPAQGQTISDPSPRFKWKTASDETGLSRHEVEVDGTLFTALTGRFWVPPANLSAGSHSYRVRAVDLAGNVGAWSPLVTFNLVPGDVDTTDEVSNKVTTVDALGFQRWRDEFFPENLFDNDPNTYYRWTNSITLNYNFLSNTARVVDAYSIRNSAAGSIYNPDYLILSGSPDGIIWTILDQKTNMIFPGTLSRVEFPVTNTTAYPRYRLLLGIANRQTFFVNEIELLKKAGTADTTAPVVTGAPSSLTTNAAFTVNLSVNENDGYYSTNGSPFAAFTTTGVSLPINITTSLRIYGRDASGNHSPTNTYNYTVITNGTTASAPTAQSMVLSTALSGNQTAAKGEWVENAELSFTATEVDVRLNRIGLQILDPNGNAVPAGQVLSAAELRSENRQVAEQKIDANTSKVELKPDFLCAAGKTHVFRIALQVSSETALAGFKWRISANDNLDLSDAGSGATVAAVDTNRKKISGIDSSLVAIRSADFSASLAAYPNPFSPASGKIKVSFYLNADGPVDAAVYTLTGSRILWLCQNRAFSKGTARFEWDGKNEKGRAVSRGVYLLEVKRSSGEKALFKIAVL